MQGWCGKRRRCTASPKTADPEYSPCATAVSAVLKLETLGNMGTADAAVVQVESGLKYFGLVVPLRL